MVNIRKAANKVARGEVVFTAKSVYDVDVDGGAAGTYALKFRLPKNAIITEIMTDELTALAGGTNVTFKAGDTALTAAIATASFTGINKHALLSSVDGIKLSEACEMKITTTGTYTAGKVRIFYKYVMSE